MSEGISLLIAVLSGALVSGFVVWWHTSDFSREILLNQTDKDAPEVSWNVRVNGFGTGTWWITSTRTDGAEFTSCHSGALLESLDTHREERIEGYLRQKDRELERGLKRLEERKRK
jgi:hypothetical protein